MIGVDWGTTRLRAFRIADNGAVLEERASDDGMGTLGPAQFESALRRVIGDWALGGAPIVCCGMVGAQQGWIEAPYAAAPAGPGEVCTAMIRAPSDLPVWIVPGVCSRDAEGALVDVMRGEETQIFGVAGPDTSGLFICPGTHSKWIEVVGGRVVRLKTFMTGELHALLATQSVLRHSVSDGQPSPKAFADGVARALGGEPPLSALFSIRVATLDGRLSADEAAATLSGLLIGEEIRAGMQSFGVAPARVIGAPAMVSLYTAALALAGFDAPDGVSASEVTPRGLLRLWRAHQAG